MQKIVPNLWFDHTAAEAAAFYTTVFPDAVITNTVRYPTEGLPDFQSDMAGEVLTVEFEIAGYRFVAINAGPEFRPNPSISFMVTFASSDPDAAARLDAAWTALGEGGRVLMGLGEYPYSPRYGWVEDRFGVSWQLMLSDAADGAGLTVVPSLLFGGPAQNRADEAMAFYADVFDGRVGDVSRYPEQTGPAPAGSVQFGPFEIAGQRFAAMDSAVDQPDSFTCGVSLMVECADQAEIDRYWNALSAVPEAEQCGWCADRFGVSWQIVPATMGDLMNAPDAYATMLQMKKIEIAAFGDPTKTYKVGYFVGSLSSTSINRRLAAALVKLAPEDLRFDEIRIDNLPLYSPDYDAAYPPEARALKDAIAAVDAVLFVTPEYNRSIPGALKNAIDWASRPYGTNSFDHIPAGVIGASTGAIGTALAQQSLRGVLSFCNARQMTAPEAYIRFTPEAFDDESEVTDDALRAILTGFMSEFHDHMVRVLTVLPRAGREAAGQ